MVALEVQSPALVARNPHTARRDFVAVVDAAYDLCVTDEAWLQGLCAAAEPVLSRGLGVFAFEYRVLADGARLKISRPTFLNCPEQMHATLCAGTLAVSPEQLLCAYRGFPCQSFSQCHDRNGQSYAKFAPARAMESRVGAADLLIVRAAQTDPDGCVLAAPTNRVVRFPARTAGVMSRVARHIAVARRLRRFVDRDETGRVVVDAEAVLAETGRVLHAEGAARGTRERAILSSAVAVLARAKGKLRRSDPEEVLRLWTALVDGKWSLVESIDSDGKRFVLVRRNTPDLKHPRGLLPTERHAAALVALGHPTKLVAYELGLSLPVVSALVASAVRKLGLRSRAELIRTFNARASATCRERAEP
jgi:DNA-binding CsgD family transcriptional regulator